MPHAEEKDWFSANAPKSTQGDWFAGNAPPSINPSEQPDWVERQINQAEEVTRKIPILGPITSAQAKVSRGAYRGAKDILSMPLIAKETYQEAAASADQNLPLAERLKHAVAATPLGVGYRVALRPQIQQAEEAGRQLGEGSIARGLFHAAAAAVPIAGPIAAQTLQDVENPELGRLGAMGRLGVYALAPKIAEEVGGLKPNGLMKSVRQIGLNPAGARAAMPAETAGLPDQAIIGAERVFRSAAPTGTNTEFRGNLYTAAPDLAEVGRKVQLKESAGGIRNPDFRVRTTVNALNDHLKQMYQTERAPQIARNAKAPVGLELSQDAEAGLRYLEKNAGRAEDRALATEALDEPSITLADADQLARVVNQELSPLRKMTAEQLAQSETTSRRLGSLKEADQALKDTINQELNRRGEPGVTAYERRYAALSRIRDQLEVRQNSLELQRTGIGKHIFARLYLGGKGRFVPSASQAAVADVNIGHELQIGLQELADSGIQAKRGIAPPAVQVRGLLPAPRGPLLTPAPVPPPSYARGVPALAAASARPRQLTAQAGVYPPLRPAIPVGPAPDTSYVRGIPAELAVPENRALQPAVVMASPEEQAKYVEYARKEQDFARQIQERARAESEAAKPILDRMRKDLEERARVFNVTPEKLQRAEAGIERIKSGVKDEFGDEFEIGGHAVDAVGRSGLITGVDREAGTITLNYKPKWLMKGERPTQELKIGDVTVKRRGREFYKEGIGSSKAPDFGMPGEYGWLSESEMAAGLPPLQRRPKK